MHKIWLVFWYVEHRCASGPADPLQQPCTSLSSAPGCSYSAFMVMAIIARYYALPPINRNFAVMCDINYISEQSEGMDDRGCVLHFNYFIILWSSIFHLLQLMLMLVICVKLFLRWTCVSLFMNPGSLCTDRLANLPCTSLNFLTIGG